MNVTLLTEHHLEFLSLTGGCTCSSESTLVKMPHCWKSRVTAHIWKQMSFENLLLICCLPVSNVHCWGVRECFKKWNGCLKLCIQEDESSSSLPRVNAPWSTRPLYEIPPYIKYPPRSVSRSVYSLLCDLKSFN